MNRTCHKMQLFQIPSISPTTLLSPYLQIAPIPLPLLAARIPTPQQVLDQEVHFSSQVRIYFIDKKKKSLRISNCYTADSLDELFYVKI